jgi:uncharacterized protein (DUF305 family)
MRNPFGSSTLQRRPCSAPRALVFALGSCFALAGCARERATAGAHDMHGMSATDISIPAGASYSVADVQFMQGMIYHHAQAIVMSRMATSHGASQSVALLAKKIDLSQQDEIAMMRRWLSERAQVVPDPDDPHPMMMPGMLSEEQMKQLDAARGTEFDRLFLTFMIQHHDGAIQMVADLFAQGGAQPSEMFQYASDIDADQRGEIGRMQQMLTSLPGTASSTQ